MSDIRRQIPAVIRVWLVVCAACSLAAAAESRPNILVIMTDDQSHDTLTEQFMPATKSLIADQGITFTNAVITTPLCCPSRTSFLTGKYARHTGVHQNDDLYTGPTFVSLLHDAGYTTGLVGKYLNSWHGQPLPEFDSWADWIHDHNYHNPLMNLAGSYTVLPGYETSVLEKLALDFLQHAPTDRPFFLLFTPHAPHHPAVPEERYAHLYDNLPPWRPPSFNPLSQSGMPDWLQDRPRLSLPNIKEEVDVFRRHQLECLKSADDAIAAILHLLQAQGRLDNTFVVFYSDNGYYWGEHRLLNKNRVYEEDCRVPFAIRYPPLIKKPRLEAHIVSNIDLAPTLCELAGIHVPSDLDGRSILPLIRRTGPWRGGILIEGWPESGSEAFQAYRTGRFVYVETVADRPELYDLRADPYEIINQVRNPKFASTVQHLKELLHQIRGPSAFDRPVVPANVRPLQIDND